VIDLHYHSQLEQQSYIVLQSHEEGKRLQSVFGEAVLPPVATLYKQWAENYLVSAPAGDHPYVVRNLTPIERHPEFLQVAPTRAGVFLEPKVIVFAQHHPIRLAPEAREVTMLLIFILDFGFFICDVLCFVINSN
jgi:hypothetical protein